MKLTFQLLCAVLGFAGLSNCAMQSPKPNVVVILVDDLGWKDLSSYGSTLYQTPHVDQLVAAGVKFTDAYAACTVCSPTRASLLTGMYPARINCTDWIKGHQRPYAKWQVPDWTQRLRAEDVTLAETLQNAGYRTAHIGKWHLGEEETDWPTYHGFDVNIGGWKMGMPKRVKKVGGYFSPYHNPRLPDGPEGEYLTERLAQEAVEFIDQQQNNPFFLNLWLYSVHMPLQAKEDKIVKYDSLVNRQEPQSNARYAAMVEHMDDAVGAVINKLKAIDRYENTIIIFASDNGGLTGTHGILTTQPMVTSNQPLRSGKGDKYEGGVRVPFIISWPYKIRGKRVTDALSITADIFPTVMHLIGETDGLPATIDGEDLTPYLLSNKKPEREALFWHYPHYHTEGATPYSAIRKGDWKLIQNYETDQRELYHLTNDIGESMNLVSEHPEKALELTQLLEEWKTEVNAQAPRTNPNYDSARAHQWRHDK